MYDKSTTQTTEMPDRTFADPVSLAYRPDHLLYEEKEENTPFFLVYL
jgi:hypothetical protein